MVARTDSRSSAGNHLARQAVIDAARAVGAVAVSWSQGDVASDVAHLQRWQAEKMHGEMAFMARAQEPTPQPLLAGLAVGGAALKPVTVMSLIFPYSGTRSQLRAIGEHRVRGAHDASLPLGHGRIAAYATGPDYHRVLPGRLKRFTEILSEQSNDNGNAWRYFTDAVPLLERAWARKSELGFQGKNTMLIRPQVGSFFFIAEVLTTASVEGEGEKVESGANCGTCERCAAACPTGALNTPYRLDARRCISYLTIEKRGVLAEWERRAIGEWLFGCDICQEVCPFNHNPITALPEFSAAKIGRFAALRDVLSLRTESDFQRLCGGTPIERTRRAGLVRNAICVAVNRAAYELFDEVLALIRDDASPTVRTTALWGAQELVSGSDSRIKFEAIRARWNAELAIVD